MEIDAETTKQPTELHPKDLHQRTHGERLNQLDDNQQNEKGYFQRMNAKEGGNLLVLCHFTMQKLN